MERSAIPARARARTRGSPGEVPGLRRPRPRAESGSQGRETTASASISTA
jgi:hypothetical protein